MTHKSYVKDFLEFLQKNPESIIATENHTYTYSTLRDSIIKTLSMAYGDGEVKGFNNCQDDTLISSSMVKRWNEW